MEKQWILGISIGIIIAIPIAIIVSFTYTLSQQECRINMLDIGQGDAFIISSGKRQIMIDAGRGQEIIPALQRTLGPFDSHIDIIVATHPDADHIGGFPFVFEKYTFDTIIDPLVHHTSELSQNYYAFLETHQEKVIPARRGTRIILDKKNGAVFDIIYPDSNVEHNESNSASVVARFVCQGISVLFTGDAPQSVEDIIAQKTSGDIDSDILKVSHHGSHTGTSDYFLEYVSPHYALISAGKNNRYGHPDERVINRLEEKNIMIYSTQQGDQTIIIRNGKIFFK